MMWLASITVAAASPGSPNEIIYIPFGGVLE
jgi:hypothetical protein